MSLLKAKFRQIARDELDTSLAQFSPLATLMRPQNGWITAIRQALGMSARQLAQRMGVASSRIGRIEQDEVSYKTTLKTMERVAEALDCKFVYALVPNTSLNETLTEQARKVARESVHYVGHTMALEDQGLSNEALQRQIEDDAIELIRRLPRNLWDKGNGI